MIDQIKSLMQKHDWHYEYADDNKSYYAGLHEKSQILQLMRKIPMKEIPALLELVPKDLRAKWMIDLQQIIPMEGQRDS